MQYSILILNWNKYEAAIINGYLNNNDIKPWDDFSVQIICYRIPNEI